MADGRYLWEDGRSFGPALPDEYHGGDGHVRCDETYHQRAERSAGPEDIRSNPDLQIVLKSLQCSDSMGFLRSGLPADDADAHSSRPTQD